MVLVISSGIYKNKRLKSIPGKELRPISGKIKEALFSILYNKIEYSNFIDICAGTGNVGFEALSRGAKEVVFVEKNPKAVQLIKNNAIKLGIIDKVKIYAADIFNFKNGGGHSAFKADIIFAGPPYKENLCDRILRHLKNNNMVNEKSIVILQHHYKESVVGNGYKKEDSRKYGITVLDFFKYISICICLIFC